MSPRLHTGILLHCVSASSVEAYVKGSEGPEGETAVLVTMEIQGRVKAIVFLT